ncbi:MAG: efflux RND transporter periplasmic adaptor subunit [Alphaproteobacteria bacterium]
MIGLAPAALSGPAAAQDEAMLVRVDTVRWVALSQTVPVIGRLVARQAGLVAARVSAPVKSFHIEVGDRVDAGEAIAALDADILTARRDLVTGRLGEVQAKLSVMKAQLKLARQEYKRFEGLQKSAAFNQARFDDARQKVVIAQAEVREAESAIASAQADLQLAEINLRDTEVRAPYAGTIVERLVEAGAYVQLGAPLVRMVGDRSLEIEADVPFQNLTGLAIGTKVNLTLDDATRHSAVVRAILPTENPLTRTRAVRLVPEFGEISRPLASEQSVTLEIPLGARRQILTVHKDAVIRRRGQNVVFIVAGEETQARPVDLGAAVGTRLEVRSGLIEGDRVVVRGNERLRPGDKVRIDGAS